MGVEEAFVLLSFCFLSAAEIAKKDGHGTSMLDWTGTKIECMKLKLEQGFSEILRGKRGQEIACKVHIISVLLLKGSLQEHFQEHHLCNDVVAICKEATIRKYDIAGYIFHL